MTEKKKLATSFKLKDVGFRPELEKLYRHGKWKTGIDMLRELLRLGLRGLSHEDPGCLDLPEGVLLKLARYGRTHGLSVREATVLALFDWAKSQTANNHEKKRKEGPAP